MNKYLTKEEMQMANKYIKRCLISYPSGNLSIKIMKYYCTFLRMTKMQNIDSTNCWQECGATEFLSLLVGTQNGTEKFWQFLTKQNLVLP